MNTVLDIVRPYYHFALAFLGAFIYGFPSEKLLVIGVTGTKGKSSTTEMLASVFEEAGYRVALLNSIRIKVAEASLPNRMRMSMPGRFFIQGFLSRAYNAGCSVAIIEMTSQGAVQFRERGIALDGLIFLNLAPEHIESHGSLEAYADAKFRLGRQLERSHKRPRVVVANAEDAQSARFLQLQVESALPFSLSADATHASDERGGHFVFDDETITLALPGEFSLKNALAAAMMARAFGVATRYIKSGLEKITTIPGRAQRIEAGQDFAVVVDYAHTPDSLEALYEAFGNTRKVCILGSTGGTRDAWNRPLKGKLAGTYCEHVILTNEDPCDDDPRTIINAIMEGLPPGASVEIILDRREAIARALLHARSLAASKTDGRGVAALFTGKGTEPNMYGPRGSTMPWNEAQIVREELGKIGYKAPA